MGSDSRFEAHFLNVDHGDCTIIRHPRNEGQEYSRVTFVDINDWKDRKEEKVAGLGYYLKKFFSSDTHLSEKEYARKYLNDPIEYFQSEVAERGEEVWRFIATHPDMDHLSGLKRLDEEVGFSVLWDPFHEKSLSREDDWHPRFDPEDWEKYIEIRSSETDHKHIHPTRGTQEQPWEDDNIEILHPSSQFTMRLNERNKNRSNPDYNNASYVIKINTEAGAVLLPGDIEEEAWEDIFNYCGDDLSDIKVLKAAHHGRNNGFHEEVVRTVNPDYVILSVGKKPSTDAHAEYRRACRSDTEILSTRQYGRIKVSVTDEGELNVEKEVPGGIFDLPGKQKQPTSL